MGAAHRWRPSLHLAAQCLLNPMSFAVPQAAVARLAAYAVDSYTYVEDHVRPVMRRYVPGPVQKKILNDCWDARPAEQWFMVRRRGAAHLCPPEGRSSSLPAGGAQLISARRRGAAHLCPYPSLISAHLRFPSAFPPLMPQVLPLVVQALPMLAQRATYIRSFMWGMPERSQQLGVMIALGVDPVNWYRLKRLIPDMIPRGEAGWRRI